MEFQGLIKTSLIDYPEKLASVAFLGGCNYKCGFCHNGDIVEKVSLETISKDTVIEHLDRRKGIIDGLVISGGEPTIHPELIDVLHELKELHIPVKLDTNGSKPDVLQRIISEELVDYVAMDIKADEEHYEAVTGVTIDFKTIEQSIDLIKNSGINYEFRTTILKELHSKTIMKNILSLIDGAEKYVMQQYIENESQIKRIDYGLVTLSELFEMKEYLEGLNKVKRVDIRGKY